MIDTQMGESRRDDMSKLATKLATKLAMLHRFKPKQISSTPRPRSKTRLLSFIQTRLVPTTNPMKTGIKTFPLTVLLLLPTCANAQDTIVSLIFNPIAALLGDILDVEANTCAAFDPSGACGTCSAEIVPSSFFLTFQVTGELGDCPALTSGALLKGVSFSSRSISLFLILFGGLPAFDPTTSLVSIFAEGVTSDDYALTSTSFVFPEEGAEEGVFTDVTGSVNGQECTSIFKSEAGPFLVECGEDICHVAVRPAPTSVACDS